ncbi:TonB-dependent receptor [uncultured Dokdonia sp.]|uniref:SusC/RagA family TonB-linked outer membrane protein n=1 Tax=Dokdonia sp. Asnod2-E02 TaxID=3160574 RepID=UPI002603D76D|nr:TonB-dependent receptor [uncultured Dokdonia sp.]
MNVKTKFSLAFFLLCGVLLFGQDAYIIKGTVVSEEDNAPIPGVSVIVQGSQNGVSTDFDGNYQLSVSVGDVLQYSYVGFATKIVPITGQTEANVSLTVDANALEEVVVIGYGTQSRTKITGAVGKVKNEDLDQIAVGTANEALVGQVAGLNIQATEGEAGSNATINIRGVGSIAGDSGPLLVVDGVVLDADFLNTVDVNDIDSVEVLKDAASAAIYGSRASGGVIIITTKQGKEGKTVFSYNTFTGFKEARQSDAYDISVAASHARELANTGELSLRSQYRELLGIDESWQDRIFDGGQIESHSLSARGGSEKTKFNTSLSYVHDEGVLITDDFKKYNFRLKVDTKVNDNFSFGANLAPSYTNRRRFDGSTHDILRQQPWLPIFHDANSIQYVDRNVYPDVQIGDYARERHFDNYDLFGDGSELVDISTTSNQNPAAKVLERDRTDKQFRMYGNFYGKYKIAEGLNFKATLGGDYQSRKQRRYQGVEASRNGASAAQLDLDNFERIHILTEALLTYDKSFGSHNLSALLGASAEKWDREYSSVAVNGFSNDLIQTLGGGTTVIENVSYNTEERLLSFFGRVNYSYEDKYLASVSLRADGHSSFGVNNKYGYFPAVSLGWNLAREDFLSESDVISNLKLRASYGFTGNKDLSLGSGLISDNIELYPSLQLYGPNSSVFNNEVVNGLAPINVANPDLQWERSSEANVAVDFGLFQGRISGSIDAYNKTSDQLLLNVPVSTTTGFSQALANRGEVVNKGIEIELRTRNITNENFTWNTTILASTNKNELTDFAGASGLITNVDSKRAAEWITLEGQPISSFYGYVVDRDIPLEFINDPYAVVGGEAQDVYVKDLNGDGLIDDEDKTIIGDPFPDLIWSVANDFQIGDVDFSFTLQGSWGAEVRNIADQYIFNQFSSREDFNTETTPDQQFIKEKIFTDDIISDASYVALRTLSLGYTFDKDLISRVGLSRARVYASGQNLMYITADGYTGWNPESYQNEGALNVGYQRGGSPIARTISLGVNLEF